MALSKQIGEKEVDALLKYIHDHPLTMLQSSNCCSFLAAHRLNQIDSATDIKAYTKLLEKYSHAHLVSHNARNLYEASTAARTFRLLAPLLTIHSVAMNAPGVDVLNIGARSETEIFQLLGLGFHPERIQAVDILSYSDWVRPQDAHELDYEDNTFDITTAAWVFAYSKDNQRMADEILRVTKHGGHIAIGCVAEPISMLENPEQADVHIGGIHMDPLDDQGMETKVSRFFNAGQVLRLFGNAVEETVLRYEPQQPCEDREDILLIFRAKKADGKG